MRALRQLRADTPPEVWTLAVLGVSGALAMGLAVLFPVASHTPVRLQLALIACALVLAGALVRFSAHVRPWMLHVILAGRTVLLAVVVAAAVTEPAAMAAALLYVWGAIYAALFFSRRAARAHTGLMLVAYGAATLLGRAPAGATVWMVTAATVWVAASVLSDLSAPLREQARSDALTGLLNRTGFAQAAAREGAIAQRQGTTPTLAVIDLDDFKLVNDLGGHASGDRLLVDLARAWRSTLRPGDLLARYGGDEFVLLLPDTSEAQARATLQRLADAHPGRWTVGLVAWAPTEALEDAIARADAILYEAKALARAASPAASHVHGRAVAASFLAG
jgi:diguanylate cyclase (GGDEF)-like protein